MKVYKFGARRPEQLDLVLDIQQRAGRYYNRLIEIERWRRIALFVADVLEKDWRDEVAELKRSDVRAARAESGLSSGTYWLVEEAAAKACSSTPRKELPKFRNNRQNPWQLIGACIPSNNDDKPIAPATEGRDLRIEAAGKYHVAKLRVLDSKHGNLWIHVPFKMHREMPTGVRIQRVALKIDRIGTRYVYSVLVTIDVAPVSKIKGSGECAVNLGWRSCGERGVRIAYAVGSDGEHHELLLPRKIVDGLRHAEGLRSLADSIAVERFGNNGARQRSKMRQMGLSQHPQQGARLGREPLHEGSSLEHWARRDRHLYQWERDEYSKALRRRREIYRLWVLDLAARYSQVLVEDWSMAWAALRTTKCEIPQSRHYRFLVSPSYLRDEIRAVFGESCLETKGKFTVTCNACGLESASAKRNKARVLVIKCERCGARWDQDANNAENQLQATAAE